MLGVSGTPVLDAVGKLGDLGDCLSGKRTLSITYGLMIRLADWSDRIRLRYILSTTIRSDGDYPLEESPVSRFLLYASGWPLMPSRFILCLLACSTILFS